MITPALKRDAQGLWWVRMGGGWEGPHHARHLAEWQLASSGVRPRGYDLIFEAPATDPEFRAVPWQEARQVLREFSEGGPLTLEPGDAHREVQS